MTQLWMDGFDQYGDGTVGRGNMLKGPWAAVDAASTPTTPPDGARTGDRAFGMYTGANRISRRVLPASLDTVMASFAFFAPEVPTNDKIFICAFMSNGTDSQGTLFLNSSGGLTFRGPVSGTHNNFDTGPILGQTTGPVFVAGSWHHIEMKFVRHASAGTLEVRIDEVVVLNLTGLNTGAASVTQLGFGDSGYTLTTPRYIYFDDMIVRDIAGTYNNNFQGDLRVATLQPLANSTNQGWSVRPIQKLGDGVLDLVSGTAFNDGVAYDDDAGLEIGSSDFCLESFIRWNQLQTGTNIEQLIGKWKSDTNLRSYRLIRKGPDDGSMLTFQTCNLGTLADVVDVIEFPFVPLVDRWYHIAISRASGTVRLFIDGVQVGVDTAESRTYFNGAAQVMVSGEQDTGANDIVADSAVEGWYDATRITIGSARYTANFTPPTTSPVTDVNTALLLNYEDVANTDESANAYVGTLINAAVDFPDDILAFQTIDGLTPVDEDFLEASLVAASGTLTLTANPLDTETVTIGAVTYTFLTVFVNAANNILIGATASDSLDNLRAAVNLEAGSGTLYGAATVINPAITQSDLPGDQQLSTAKTPGAAGNSLATTETITGGSWSAATLLGGLDIPGNSEFSMSALPAEVTGIKAVALVGRNFKADSGSSEMRMSLNTLAGAVSNGATRSLTLSPVYYEDTIEQDPNTLGALTVTTILGALFRIDRIT